jgi:hypothetical protein
METKILCRHFPYRTPSRTPSQIERRFRTRGSVAPPHLPVRAIHASKALVDRHFDNKAPSLLEKGKVVGATTAPEPFNRTPLVATVEDYSNRPLL